MYSWLHGHKSCPFVFHQPVFKKSALPGLNSLQQKRCWNSTWYFMILPHKNISSKHQNKTEFKNLDDSEFRISDFPGVRTSAASMTSTASTTSIALLTLTTSYHQKYADPDSWSFLTPKWPILVPLCGMDHQISNFSLIPNTLYVGGCRGQLMILFWKLVDKTKIGNPPDHAGIYYQKFQSLYPYELFTLDHFFMQNPVSISLSIYLVV